MKKDSLPSPSVTEAIGRNRRRTASTSSLALMSILAIFVLPSCSIIDRSLGKKESISFTNYDEPLYGQITNRIRRKIFMRLGEGKQTEDRYFIIPFAYQNRRNDPGVSHSFITFVRVLADDNQPRQNKGLETRTYKDRDFEAFNISWLPSDFMENPNLCVFKGIRAATNPAKNKCPTLPGKNTSLENTIKLAVNVQNAVCMWGPYEIKKEAFEVGIRRKDLLDGGTIRYRADDRLTRKDQSAINCFHAMAGLDDPFPDGGIFGSGLGIWGIKGTAQVLLEYTETANINHLLLEPVNEKEDRYGFVYASSQDARRIYAPFVKASAYRR